MLNFTILIKFKFKKLYIQLTGYWNLFGTEDLNIKIITKCYILKFEIIKYLKLLNI